MTGPAGDARPSRADGGRAGSAGRQPRHPAPPPDPRLLGRMDLEAHLGDPALKQSFVTPMFDVIAPSYDRFTRVFSFGMDRRWKRELLADLESVAPADATVVDLACGTGDLALEVAARLPLARITGLDASHGMIDAARHRVPPALGARLRFVVGDMGRIPVADASVDVVTAGYALRNAPDLREALAELARVVRPGGTVLILDFHRPENRVWRALFVAYLRVAGALVGWLWHRVPVVYAYLGPSVAHFVSSRALVEALDRAGFDVEVARRRLLGGIAMHRARRRIGG